PQHDFCVFRCDITIIYTEKEAVGDIVLRPQDEVFGLATRKQLALDAVDAVETTIEVATGDALPESRADVEGVVAVLRGDEDVGIDDVSLRIGHHRWTPSRDAYSWKAPPRSPVRS